MGVIFEEKKIKKKVWPGNHSKKVSECELIVCWCVLKIKMFGLMTVLKTNSLPI